MRPDVLGDGVGTGVTGQVHAEAWTDRAGARRARQVISDAEVGASMRFTTVQVARGSRE
jgi:single-stranded DNA-binding protein